MNFCNLQHFEQKKLKSLINIENFCIFAASKYANGAQKSPAPFQR